MISMRDPNGIQWILTVLIAGAQTKTQAKIAQSAWAAEYIDCISAEE